MGFENRIFISAEQFTMSSSNSTSSGGGAAHNLSRSVDPSPIRGGSSEAAVVVDNSLQSSKPSGGRGGAALRSRGSSGRAHAPRLVACVDQLHVLHERFNRCEQMLSVIDSLFREKKFTCAQAATAIRAQVNLCLNTKPTSDYSGPKFAFLAAKILKGLISLGKRHAFTETDLVLFVLQCTNSKSLYECFTRDALQPLLGNETKIFWLLVWVCVMTMTDIPTMDQQFQDEFYNWFQQSVAGNHTQKLSYELASIVESIQTKVTDAYSRIGDQPQSDKAAIVKACKGLCIDVPLDEDGEEDDTQSLGGQSAASSVSGDRTRDPLKRFHDGFAKVKSFFGFFVDATSLVFNQMKPQQCVRIARGLIRRMTRRTKGKQSLRNFNRSLSEKLLAIVNKFNSKYKLDINEITVRIIQATGHSGVGSKWFELVSSVTVSPAITDRVLVSALLLINLGNHTALDDMETVGKLFQACLRDDKVDLEKKFSHIVESALEKAWKDSRNALAGKWTHDDECDSQPAAVPARACARGGDNSSESTELARLLKAHVELEAKIAKAREAEARKARK